MLAGVVLNYLQKMEVEVPPPAGQHHSFTCDGENLILTFRTGKNGSLSFFISREELEQKRLDEVVNEVLKVMSAC